MDIQSLWKSQTIPESAKVTVFSHVKIENGTLIFQSNEEVIGRCAGDPDGGRGSYSSAKIETEDFSLEFFYREKLWTGLTVRVHYTGNQYPEDLPDELDQTLPAFAAQLD